MLPKRQVPHTCAVYCKPVIETRINIHCSNAVCSRLLIPRYFKQHTILITFREGKFSGTHKGVSVKDGRNYSPGGTCHFWDGKIIMESVTVKHGPFLFLKGGRQQGVFDFFPATFAVSTILWSQNICPQGLGSYLRWSTYCPTPLMYL